MTQLFGAEDFGQGDQPEELITIFINGTGNLRGLLFTGDLNKIKLECILQDTGEGKKNFVFNWSHSLNEAHREAAAEVFYEKISELIEENPNIKTKIIAHSHGANIVTKSISIAKCKKNDNYYIDDLILTEPPVYDVTEQGINEKNSIGEYYARKVYNVVAGKDYTQVIDFTAHFPFCKRVLDQREGIFYIHSLTALSHLDWNLMIMDRDHFVLLDDEQKKKLSNACYEKYNLKGIWCIWHDYGKSIAYFFLFIFFIIQYKENIKDFYEILKNKFKISIKN